MSNCVNGVEVKSCGMQESVKLEWPELYVKIE